MAIKRFYADKDNTITNAYKSNLTNSGSEANMGASDILEVFSIYGQASSSSLEASRILISFPINEISSSRFTSKEIPASGSVKFYLRMFNARHSQTLPEKYYLHILPINTQAWPEAVDPSQDEGWTEGYGLDMEGYTDSGSSNWNRARADQYWASPGAFGAADYNRTEPASSGHAERSITASAYFERGDEDMKVDVTDWVEAWLRACPSGAIYQRYDGVMIRMSGAYENESQFDDVNKRSYYTKKFFSRGTQFFFKKPCLEAQWDSSVKDRRASFYASSSLVATDDNLNKVYLYNYVRGQLKNIPLGHTAEPTKQDIYVNLYADVDGVATGDPITTVPLMPVTGGIYKTGIYSASIAVDTTASILHDVWFSGSNQYFTGTINVKNFAASGYNDAEQNFVTSLRNLKPSYSKKETPRLRLFTRVKDWNPNVYTKASKKATSTAIEDAFYKVVRVADDFEAISYGTGSNQMYNTRLSCDVSGNYFDLDMSLLEPDYMYEIKFLYYLSGQYHEQDEKFRFRVDKDEH